jgi:hypothetical protein
MSFPGGLLQREDEKSGNVSYSLIGSLKGCDPYAKDRSTNDDDMSKLYNFLLDVREKLVQARKLSEMFSASFRNDLLVNQKPSEIQEVELPTLK